MLTYYSQVGSNAPLVIDDDGGFFDSRPEVALLVAKIIVSWSTVESFVNLATTSLLAGRSSVAMAMIEVISDSSSRNSVLYAAAEAALPPSDAKLFKRAVKALKSLGKVRHQLAHGIFAHSEALKDSVVLIEQRDYAEYSKIAVVPPKSGETAQHRNSSAFDRLARRAVVLGNAELRKAQNDVDLANRIASNLVVLATEGHHEKEAARTDIRTDLEQYDQALGWPKG